MSTLAERMGDALLHRKALEPENSGIKIHPRWLAGQCGIAPSSVAGWFDGETKSLKAKTAIKAAAALRVNLTWLTEGLGQMTDGVDPNTPFHTAVPGNGTVHLTYSGHGTQAPAGASSVQYHDTAHSGSSSRKVAQLMIHPSSTLAQTVQVPLLSVEASMGPGSESTGEDVMVGTLSLSPQWISAALRPTRPEALRFIHGHGDSMAPTYNSGDVLLVDTDVAEVQIPGIYVLRAHEQLFIKRVNRRLDGAYEITSDNPAHRTVETLSGEHQVSVLGRVIWVWNGRKI